MTTLILEVLRFKYYISKTKAYSFFSLKLLLADIFGILIEILSFLYRALVLPIVKKV